MFAFPNGAPRENRLNPSRVLAIADSDEDSLVQPIKLQVSQSQTQFISNPLDRFIMLLSNASRKNRHVSRALDDSNVRNLVQHMLDGQLDLGKLDESSKDWRRRTCTEILSQKASKLSR